MDDHSTTAATAPPDWIEALDRGQADLSAGRTETWVAVRARIVAAIEAMENKQASRPA